jgi:hypothetical protein
MSDFWTSEIGEVTGNPADAFAKSFKQIPDGTMALAKIEAFVNSENKDTGFKCLVIEWLLTDGDFKGQKVQQKVKVFGGDKFDKDPVKTRHRALNMLKLLHQLFAIKLKHSNAPTDQDLASFVGKCAGVKIRETEPNAEGRQYNWVSEVHDTKGFKCETGISVVVTHKNPVDAFYATTEDENDVPF